MRWSRDGYIILDDTITEKVRDEVTGVGYFYDHTEGDTVWDQDTVYAFYTDHKIAYQLTFRLYEQQDEDDQARHRGRNLPHLDEEASRLPIGRRDTGHRRERDW